MQECAAIQANREASPNPDPDLRDLLGESESAGDSRVEMSPRDGSSAVNEHSEDNAVASGPGALETTEELEEG